MATDYYAWWGKQVRLGTFDDFYSRWEVSSKQLPRSDAYKGEQDVMMYPGLKYDVCSSLGLLFIIGILAQVRGLALDTQRKCVALLRRVFSLFRLDEGLKILRNLTLKVVDGCVSIKKFFNHFDEDVRASLRSRRVFLFSVCNVLWLGATVM